MKKVLVLGATGAMGQHLVPDLAERGYQVDAAALDEPKGRVPGVNCIKGDLKDLKVLDELLKNPYDGIVDFLIYNTGSIGTYVPRLIDSAGHYIYLSSYRIYDDKEHPIQETSPRLIDSSDDVLLKNSDDYCIFKARGENIVRSTPVNNWTIIRPAITYSLMRYQLVTLEAPDTIGRAFAGKKTILPIQAKNVQGTMSWAGDVATMISRLLFNERALRETFSVTTAEHHAWGEIADYYKDICKLDSVWVDKEDYIRALSRTPDPYAKGVRWQLEYDRLFNRVMDNSKVLSVTGLKQSDFMPLYDGLKYEISRCPSDFAFRNNEKIDDLVSGN